MKPTTIKPTTPFGTWASPVTADIVSAASVYFSEPQLHGNDLFWLEQRPQEGGRQTLMHEQPEGTVVEILPASHNIRSKVHEYGGGCYTVHNKDIYFVEEKDQQVYRIRNSQVKAITAFKDVRFADFSADPLRQRLYAIAEDHRQPGPPKNSLVAISIDDKNTGQVVELTSGYDFYSTPKPSPDGTALAWLSWNHPNMPWDGTELWLADIDNQGLLKRSTQAAGSATESIFQPQWSDQGQLYAVSDRTGWWNLYRYDAAANKLTPLAPMQAECGLPQWQFGMRSYDVIAEDELLVIACSKDQGVQLLHIQEQKVNAIAHPFSKISYPWVSNRQAVFIASYPDQPIAVVRVNCETRVFKTVAKTSENTITSNYISVAEHLGFQSTGGRTAYAYFYPPKNTDFNPPADEKPPLIVTSHGGPTASTDATFSPKIQFWTSRGFAVVDVNYNGSSMYGRAYRDALKGQWGIIDVDDCIAAAQYLVQRGDVDSDRLCIRGSSASGYTTLAALTFHDVFKAGASYYGIGDLVALAQNTHKFEAKYLDSLIGPWPEAAALYADRSPCNHVDRLSCPVIFFQGLKDKIVPPAQAEIMVKILTNKGIPVAHVTFADEAHGFIRAEDINRALECELAFYGAILNFTPADQPQMPTIRNLQP